MTQADLRSLLDALAARSHEIRTPCGDGSMMWRAWGERDNTAPPVVLLHGGFGSWKHWVRNIPAFEDEVQLIAADLPGCGESAMPDSPYDADSLAAIVSDGIDRVVPDGQPFDLVSFSFGGVISGLIAQRQAARLRSLTIVGTPILGLINSGPATELVPVPRDLTPEEAAPLYRGNLEKLMVLHPSSVDDLAMTLHMDNMAQARLRSRRIAWTHPVAADLPGTSCALNFIFGAGDITLDPGIEGIRAHVAEHHPDAGFEVIPDAGHWVQYEAAAPFNASLRAWLSGLNAAR